MSTRVGLALMHDAVRAVMLSGERLLWASESPLLGGVKLRDAIATVLADAPVRKWPRPVLSAVVGAHASQLKLVTGLPDTTDAGILGAIVREAPRSFFLQNGSALRTTGVRPLTPGSAWAGAIEQSYVDAVQDACRARGWRLGLIAPAAVALPLATTDQAFSRSYGNLVLTVACAEGQLREARVHPARTSPSLSPPPTPVEPLSRLGDRAPDFVEAYGAASLSLTEPLAVGRHTSKRRATAFRAPLVPPAVCLVIGIVSLALSPLGSTLAERRARALLNGVSPVQQQAVESSRASLDEATAILTTVGDFAGSRAGVLTLLGELARVLPDSSALMALDLEPGRIQLSVTTRHASAVLSGMRRAKGVSSAEMTGSLTRVVGGAPGLQRVTVRLQLESGQYGPGRRAAQ